MPISALPDHLKDINYWKDNNTDNASWLMRLKKRVQYALAAGPRVPSGFFRWREIPKTLFAFRGSGKWRVENSDGTNVFKSSKNLLVNQIFYLAYDNPISGYSAGWHYLSRIQPWCRWHIALQWPLFFNCHVIYCQKNVVEFPTYKSEFGICKLLTFGVGFKRDADRVYILTANLGGNFE